MPVTWDRSYEVGIGVIDFQHQKLVRFIAELQTAMAAGRGKDTLDPLLAQVADYAQVHFVTEEQIMEDARYPLLETHRVQHRRILACIEALRQKHSSGSGIASVDVLDFLMGWFGKHTLGHDVSMARYVISVRDNPRLDLILGEDRAGTRP